MAPLHLPSMREELPPIRTKNGCRKRTSRQDMVLEKRSPSLHFQVKLLEEELIDGGQRPSNNKTKLATDILEEIIPHTGVYKDVLTLVLETLKHSIYSTTLTSSPHQEQYLPYFEMVFRLEEERHHAAAVLKDESDQLRSEVHKRKNESENIAALLDEKSARISELEEMIENLKVEIQSRDEVISKHQADIDSLHHGAKKLESAIASNEEYFHSCIVKKEKQIEEVSTYKDDYYKMQTDFFQLREKTYSDKRTEGSQSEQIRAQLLDLINMTMDEQDKFHEKYNNEVLREHLGNNGLKAKQSEDLSVWHKKYILMRENFAKMGLSVLNELKLLTTHINYEIDMQENVISDGEEDTEVSVKNLFADGKDPFNPTERITAKYSASIEVSTNDCTTFSLIPGSKQCKSCNCIVFICPHVFSSPETIIHLPKNTTHMRVSRPLLTAPSIKCLEIAEQKAAQSDDTEMVELNKKLLGMWRKCARTPYHIPREFSEQYILTCIHNFYLYLINIEQQEVYKSLLDRFMDYITDLYQLEELMEIVIVDILSGVSKYSASNPYIAVFGMTLAGTLDPITFRYVYILNDIFLNLDLVCTLDLRPLMMVLYPFLTDEDIDPHVLNYSSHTNNRISPHHISRYLMYCIINDKEPRNLESLSKLKQNCITSPQNMTMKEFNLVLETVYPLATNKTKEEYFKTSLVNIKDEPNFKTDRVQTKHLAQIVSYMQLVHSVPKIISDINDKIHHYRNKIPADMIEAGLKQRQTERVTNVPSYEQSKKQLVSINKAAKSLELLQNNPCWRQDMDIAPVYLELTR